MDFQVLYKHGREPRFSLLDVTLPSRHTTDGVHTRVRSGRVRPRRWGIARKILYTAKSRMKEEIKEKGYSPRMVCLFSAGERLKTLACSPGSVL